MNVNKVQVAPVIPNQSPKAKPAAPMANTINKAQKPAKLDKQA